MAPHSGHGSPSSSSVRACSYPAARRSSATMRSRSARTVSARARACSTRACSPASCAACAARSASWRSSSSRIAAASRALAAIALRRSASACPARASSSSLRAASSVSPRRLWKASTLRWASVEPGAGPGVLGDQADALRGEPRPRLLVLDQRTLEPGERLPERGVLREPRVELVPARDLGRERRPLHQPGGVRERAAGERGRPVIDRRAGRPLDEPGRDPPRADRRVQPGQLEAPRLDRRVGRDRPARELRRGRDLAAGERELAIEPRRLVPRPAQAARPDAAARARAAVAPPPRAPPPPPRAPRSPPPAPPRAAWPRPASAPPASAAACRARARDLRRVGHPRLVLDGLTRGLLEHRDRERRGLAGGELLGRERRLHVRADRQPGVDLRAGHPLEQLAAVLALGAQERRELALREQRGAPELIERQPEPRVDRLEGLGLGAAEPLAPLERGQRHLLRLDRPIDCPRARRTDHRAR